MLGEPLKSMYSGDMQWIGVSKPFYWQVSVLLHMTHSSSFLLPIR